jgi:hypothetical protein
VITIEFYYFSKKIYLYICWLNLKSWFKEEIPTKKECVTCDCYCERKIKGKIKRKYKKENIKKSNLTYCEKKNKRNYIYFPFLYRKMPFP